MNVTERNKEEIERINKVKRYAKEIEKVTSIDWETDINKMNFSKLRNAEIRGLTLKGVEYIETPEGMIYFDDGLFELIDFVNIGNKIIPPLYLTTHKIVDGEIESVETFRFDGTHRIMLANLLKLKQIPVVMFEVDDYYFNTEYWDIQEDGLNVIIQSISEEEKYTFKLSEVVLSQDFNPEERLRIESRRY